MKPVDSILLDNGANAKLGGAFHKFAASEYSTENILAYGAMATFAGNRSWVMKQVPGSSAFEQALYIYQQFLTSSSSLEINTSKTKIKEVEKVLFGRAHDQKRRNAISGHVSRTIFASILDDVRLNLIDTLARFSRETAYHHYFHLLLTNPHNLPPPIGKCNLCGKIKDLKKALGLTKTVKAN